ncbi:hypothetical protein Pla110_13660 [Polystyrenella longa]|uniref:Peptidase S1 domain-containing protein n=1 Tax=Polystyrenella longa TaxID=2528007 RepID=A0A518CK99_9PLAN|nr:hypothetical protein [Polystyrenella longa]QDU79655.1 hypothetical protein Pla110_13660 [Polystyrenella longa]
MRSSEHSKELAGNGRFIVFSVVGVILILALAVAHAKAGPPDPWVRMTKPSGCSGVVFAASKENGIWLQTCRHCVTEKQVVSFRFFKDGQASPPVDGVCVAHHNTADIAICWVDASQLNYSLAVRRLFSNYF